MPDSAAVRKAKQASASTLAELIPAIETIKDSIYRLVVVASSDLSQEEREVLWNLADTNMRDIAFHSSMGWDPSAKKQELFHRYSRFILVYKYTEADEEQIERPGPDAITAFTMFRFVLEAGDNVLYCYELQVSPSMLRRGLGQSLIHHLTRLGKAWKMSKMMLTVLNANEDAMKFYKAIGFEVDPISPDPDDPEELEDYEILSMSL